MLGPHERFEGTSRNSGSGLTLITGEGTTVDIDVPDWYPGGLAIDVAGVFGDGFAADVRVSLDGAHYSARTR